MAATLGSTLIAQGGRDDASIKGASPAYLTLALNGQPSYSYPFAAFPRDLTTLLGTGNDVVAGGPPPDPLFFAVSLLVSMSPLVFSCADTWYHFDQPLFAAHSLEVAAAGGATAPNSSWTTVGMVAGHSAVRVANSVFFVGGFGASTLPTTAPVGVPSATNMRVNRAAFAPVCAAVEATNLSSFAGGRRQSEAGAGAGAGASVCFPCSPGSRLAFASDTGAAQCDLVSAGVSFSFFFCPSHRSELPPAHTSRPFGIPASILLRSACPGSIRPTRVP